AARIALVVGGCGGIDLALVTALHAQGLRVVVMDLASSLQARPLPDGVARIADDLREELSVIAAFKALAVEHSHLDYLVNVAGYTSALQPVEELGTSTFDDIHAGNLRGMLLCCKHVLPVLRAGND